MSYEADLEARVAEREPYSQANCKHPNLDGWSHCPDCAKFLDPCGADSTSRPRFTDTPALRTEMPALLTGEEPRQPGAVKSAVEMVRDNAAGIKVRGCFDELKELRKRCGTTSDANEMKLQRDHWRNRYRVEAGELRAQLIRSDEGRQRYCISLRAELDTVAKARDFWHGKVKHLSEYGDEMQIKGADSQAELERLQAHATTNPFGPGSPELRRASAEIDRLRARIAEGDEGHERYCESLKALYDWKGTALRAQDMLNERQGRLNAAAVQLRSIVGDYPELTGPLVELLKETS